MTKMTRREFLKLASTSAGALIIGKALSGCSSGVIEKTAAATSAGQEPVQTTSLAEETSTSSMAQTRTPGKPDLVVARQGEPEELVRLALEPFGGMKTFVSSGANVIIKPNICIGSYGPEYATTTNPWVVAALVKACFEAGAKTVRVMDFPFGSTPEQAYAASGIEEQVKAAGGEMVIMSQIKYVSVKIPQGKALKKVKVYDDILKADVLINVPIVKDHGMSHATLAMKNLMGTILARETLHSNLGQSLADLASIVRPTLNVVDAVRILTANGPTGGSLDYVKKMDTVIVSPDIVAADSVAGTLLGYQPRDLAFIQAATQMGLGNSDFNSMKIEEVFVGG